MTKIAIIGASGKLGGATLSALLKHKLSAPADIIALTSSTSRSSPTWTGLLSQGVEVRHARFEDPSTLEQALQGVDTFFLVSTPDIALDFGLPLDFDGISNSGNSARGRESHHKHAIDAAVSAGVKRIVYSSLAFAFSSPHAQGHGHGAGDVSKGGVMRAHLRTEAYLASVRETRGVEVTILREGLYNESWPLYLGYFDVAAGEKERDVVPLADDGKMCWTAIHDLGVASALVLVSDEDVYKGRTLYLSTGRETARSVGEIAELVGEARGRPLRVEIVGRDEYERYYVEEQGKPRPAVEWWAGTYEALKDGECFIDDSTLETLLESVGLKPIPVEETIKAMVGGGEGWRSKQEAPLTV